MKQQSKCLPPICLLIVASFFVVPPFASALSAWNLQVNNWIGKVTSLRKQESGYGLDGNGKKSYRCHIEGSQFQQQSILPSLSRTLVKRSKRSLFSISSFRGGTTTTTVYASEGGENELTKDMSPYHLLWSPGSWRKIITSTIGIAVLHLFLSRMVPQFEKLTFFIGKEHHSPFCQEHVIGGFGEGALPTAGTNKASTLLKLFNFLTIPLLSSACCSIQLILNALAGLGCAGFNTYLGPLRPYFISILMYSTTMSFPSSLAWSSMKKWAMVSVTSWFIALMPELVHFWDNILSHRVLTSNKDDSALMTTKATLELNIPSMGCVACINKINSSIRTQSPSHILEASSWLTKDKDSGGKGGKAKILLSASSEQEARNIVKVIVDSVEKSGFACSVDKLSIDT